MISPPPIPMSSSIQGVAPATPSPQQQSSITDAEMEIKVNELFSNAMRSKWREVAAMYASSKEVRVAKLTRAGDTVLHVAVSSHDEANVMLLMDSLDKDDAETTRKTLSMENERKDTPLHLAAALGMEGVCLAMAKLSPDLVTKARNKRGETPLFKAVRHGKRNAFFALQSVVESQIEPPPLALSDKPRVLGPFCRREDGDTILHNAIFGEHFDLALEIIKQYPELVNSWNEKGELPLHILANKPLVFKSGIHFSLLDSIIYYCTFVDPLEEKYPKYKEKFKEKKLTDIVKVRQNGREKLPENCYVCYDIFILLKHVFKAIVPSFRSFFNGNEESFAVAEDDPEDGGKADQRYSAKRHGSRNKRRFPENYDTFYNFVKLAMKVLLVIIGIGMGRIQKIKKKKRQNVHACQILKELVGLCKEWRYDKDGKNPYKQTEGAPTVSTDRPPDETEDGANKTRSAPADDPKQLAVWKKLGTYLDKQLEDDSKSKNQPVGATPILVAAKRGVTEMVKTIVDEIPVAALDLDKEDKNVVLLAVEHRQPRVYKLMLKRKIMQESVFGAVDKDGNTALHLAATLGYNRPWVIPGAALQMQWEIRWYKYVLRSMDPDFFMQHNSKGEAAIEIFTRTHESLVKDAGKWLNNTSQSCSVVAALIATVAFTSATTVPGGVKQDSGFPIFEGKPAFQVFALAALVALCFSVTSLVMFLSILTSRFQEQDFEKELPVKLILGLTTLFMSIGANLLSFCAGHFFVIEEKFKLAAYPIYAAVCLPVSFFAVAQLPLYIDLIKATFAEVPQRTKKLEPF